MTFNYIKTINFDSCEQIFYNHEEYKNIYFIEERSFKNDYYVIKIFNKKATKSFSLEDIEKSGDLKLLRIAKMFIRMTNMHNGIAPEGFVLLTKGNKNV
jgi:hypothetical protein